MEILSKKKRDPLCFIEVVDVSLGTDPVEIEEKVERAYSLIQDACDTSTTSIKHSGSLFFLLKISIIR